MLYAAPQSGLPIRKNENHGRPAAGNNRDRSRSAADGSRPQPEHLSEMPRRILVLLLTSCATSTSAQVPAVQDQIACYNVITGRVFSAIECGLRFAVARTDRANSTLELKFVMAMASGPAFARESKAKGIMRFYVVLGPASWRAEANPFKRFHRRTAPKRKWSSANV